MISVAKRDNEVESGEEGAEGAERQAGCSGVSRALRSRKDQGKIKEKTMREREINRKKQRHTERH